MRTHLSLPALSLFGIVLCFGVLFWLDQVPAQTQSISLQQVEPFPLFQMTAERGEPVSAEPTNFVSLNGVRYFELSSQRRGLWRTDGTAEGTVLVKDLHIVPGSLQAINGTLYFAVEGNFDDPWRFIALGALWKSDGTTAGTVMVRGGLNVRPDKFATIGETIYFGASDGVHGFELWQTDGTTDGTRMVADGQPGAHHTYFGRLIAAGQMLYFMGYDHLGNDYKLWQSDGTAAGTRIVVPVPGRLGQMVAFQGELYLSATDWELGYELWRHDGSASGPTLVKDILVGADSSWPSQFVIYHGALYFLANDGNQSALWRTDGTAAGTEFITDLGFAREVAVINDRLFFMIEVAHEEYELWSSDGTAAGTERFVFGDAANQPGLSSQVSVVDGTLYFMTRIDDNLQELWRSDGTVAGTKRIPIESAIQPVALPLANINGTLLFRGDDETRGDELWRSDGTAVGTELLKDLDPNHHSPDWRDAAAVTGHLYATSETYELGTGAEELWISVGPTEPAVKFDQAFGSIELFAGSDYMLIGNNDASGATLYRHTPGASILTVLAQFTRLSFYRALSANGYLFFQADGGVWRTDGTAEGTLPLAVASALDNHLIVLRNRSTARVITANDQTIWLTDGTEDGTTHFTPGAIQSPISGLIAGDTIFYFSATTANDPTNVTWWRSNGTSAGTWPLFYQGRSVGGGEPTVVGDALYLTSYDAEHGPTILYASGQTAMFVRTTNIGVHSETASPIDVRWRVGTEDRYYVVLNDGLHGPELWSSDGSTGGTGLVRDIVPAVWDTQIHAYPGPLFSFGDLLIFGADDGQAGRELWRSDGTAAGTRLIKDIHVGPGSSVPVHFIQGNGRFYFSADDGIHGRELWQSDGTSAGTVRVTDLYSGGGSARPQPYLFADGSLFFTANNGRDGNQFYHLYTGQALALPYQLYLPVIDR